MDKIDWQSKGEGHRQRLRDKFLNKGIGAFTDAEILELLLTFGTPRTDCKDAARAALAECNGSLASVLEAPFSKLEKIHGIGPKNIFALHFVNGVARHYLKQRLQQKNYITSSREVADYLIHAMRDLKREVFMAIFLDATHAIIDSKIISEGTISVNTVYPRELIKDALEFNAAALVIAHNHPSGSMKPSPQDVNLTKTLHLTCSLMNIQLLDHLIIGESEDVYSFADHGMMDTIRNDHNRSLKN